MDKKTLLRNLRTAKKLVARKFKKNVKLSWQFLLDDYTFPPDELDEILESDLDRHEKMELLARRSYALFVKVDGKNFDIKKEDVNKIIRLALKNFAFLGSSHVYRFPNFQLPQICDTCEFRNSDKFGDARCAHCKKNEFVRHGVTNFWSIGCDYASTPGLN